MMLVGCTGFPVPATRYLREFLLVEVADTFLGVPGPALLRRWRREAPEGFVFTALAPRDLTADAFRSTAIGDAAWEAFVPVARELSARAIVVSSPVDASPSKQVRAAARALFERIDRPGLPSLVWEPPPTWELRECEALVKDLGVLVARDPARHPPYAKVPFGYYRLPGPAGHRSRYEDPSLETVTKTLRETKIDETLVIFANVDMYADSKRLRRLLDEG